MPATNSRATLSAHARRCRTLCIGVMITSGVILTGDRAEAAPLKLGAWAISAAADDSLIVEVAHRGGGGGGGARRAGMNRGGAGFNRAGFNRGGAGLERGGVDRAANFNRTNINRTNINRDVNVNRGAFAQGAGRYPNNWRRPANYWWPVGGAIAAGAAIGYLGSNAAYAYAGSSAPGPGYCWYYTDQSQTQGFWDVCPQQ
jgi:hypothetical protein